MSHCQFKISKNKLLRLFVFIVIGSNSVSIAQNSTFLDSLLKTDLGKYSAMLNHPGQYKLQVIYTKIDRDEKNKPSFTDYFFHINNSYVYPASTVKLPIALLALMKLNDLALPGLTANTPMITDSTIACRRKIVKDSTSINGFPTIENYIKKMFLVSDNSACARTYEFVGYDYVHNKLNDLGYRNIRLFNRLEGYCASDTLGETPAIYFMNGNDTVYKQAAARHSLKLVHPIKNSTAGVFHRENGGWIKGPKDFSDHNYLEMKDLHKLMTDLVFNEFSAENKLKLREEDRLLMLKQLGSYPRESDAPKYDQKIYYDSFKKYFIYGSSVPVITQDSLRIMNIVGRAYGFLIDCAYIVDLKNNIEFLLTSSVYVNAGGRIGSGKYEYDQLGMPFLKDLGLCIYQYEKQRKKNIEPDLTEFKSLFKAR